MGSKKLDFSAEGYQNYENNITLLRKDIYKNFIWPILLLLIGLMLQSHENHWKIKWRLITYIIVFVSIYFTLPSILNVPILNLLSISVWLCYIVLLIFIEIKYYKKTKDNNKKISTNKKFKSEKYKKARKK